MIWAIEGDTESWIESLEQDACMEKIEGEEAKEERWKNKYNTWQSIDSKF